MHLCAHINALRDRILTYTRLTPDFSPLPRPASNACFFNLVLCLQRVWCVATFRQRSSYCSWKLFLVNLMVPHSVSLGLESTLNSGDSHIHFNPSARHSAVFDASAKVATTPPSDPVPTGCVCATYRMRLLGPRPSGNAFSLAESERKKPKGTSHTLSTKKHSTCVVWWKCDRKC